MSSPQFVGGILLAHEAVIRDLSGFAPLENRVRLSTPSSRLLDFSGEARNLFSTGLAALPKMSY